MPSPQRPVIAQKPHTPSERRPDWRPTHSSCPAVLEYMWGVRGSSRYGEYLNSGVVGHRGGSGSLGTPWSC
jgi:hypothetical protein